MNTEVLKKNTKIGPDRSDSVLDKQQNSNNTTTGRQCMKCYLLSVFFHCSIDTMKIARVGLFLVALHVHVNIDSEVLMKMNTNNTKLNPLTETRKKKRRNEIAKNRSRIRAM